jgi:hypothetical protein
VEVFEKVAKQISQCVDALKSLTKYKEGSSDYEKLYAAAIEAPDLFKRKRAERIPLLTPGISLAKFAFELEETTPGSYRSYYNTPSYIQDHKEYLKLCSSQQYQRHAHHVIAAGNTKSAMEIDVNSSLSVVTDNGVNNKFVVTNISGNTDLYISFRVTGYTHRLWVHLEENQDPDEIKLIERPERVKIGKYVNKDMTLSSHRNWWNKILAFYFEIGLDRL